MGKKRQNHQLMKPKVSVRRWEPTVRAEEEKHVVSKGSISAGVGGVGAGTELRVGVSEAE